MASELLVVDPAVKIAEIDCFNLISRCSPLKVSYHLPAMQGMATLRPFGGEQRPAGLIILGSASSVHDRHPWQDELSRWLEGLMEARVPILGICYGHQLLAYLAGGAVVFAKGGEKLTGLRQIHVFSDHRLKLEANQGEVVVSHKEMVKNIPSGWQLWAESELVPVEGLRHPQLPIWSLQAHPEATPLFCQQHHLGLPLAFLPQAFAFGYKLLLHFMEILQD